MKIIRLASQGFQAMGSSRLRTFLMMAGIIVGIAALTVILAIGAGTERTVMQRVSIFGFRTIMIMAGGGRTLGPAQENVTTLRPEDAAAIRARLPEIEVMAPAATRPRMPIKAGPAQSQAMVVAADAGWHDAWEWYVEQGDSLSDEDVAALARVCILGETIREELFGEADPVGEYVQLGNVRFQVKGVLARKGTSPLGSDMDRRVLIPLSTGLRRLFNQEHLGQIRIKMKDDRGLEAAAGQIRALLRERHHITPPREDDFQVRSAADVAKVVRGISGLLSKLLAALATLSLLVGGVVLMNILLISVSERVREIGLRRAVGASQRDIFVQFVAESLAITLIGMLLGSALGWSIVGGLAAFTEIPAAVSWEPFTLGLALALAVGLFFGIQPARRAARLHPVQALR
jgi:putative ABC transport system permease protein